MHGLRGAKPNSIKVTQPNNFGATFLNIIGGSPPRASHKEWIVDSYYGQGQALQPVQIGPKGLYQQ